MASIEINTQNLASTRRPDEYKGTIALDHHTAGNLFDELLEENVGNFMRQGYMFVGVRLDFGGPVDEEAQDDVTIDFILLSKDNKLYSVSKDIKLSQFVYAFTRIVVQFTDRTTFESDSLNWDSIEEITETDEE